MALFRLHPEKLRSADHSQCTDSRASGDRHGPVQGMRRQGGGNRHHYQESPELPDLQPLLDRGKQTGGKDTQMPGGTRALEFVAGQDRRPDREEQQGKRWILRGLTAW